MGNCLRLNIIALDVSDGVNDILGINIVVPSGFFASITLLWSMVTIALVPFSMVGGLILRRIIIGVLILSCSL